MPEYDEISQQPVVEVELDALTLADSPRRSGENPEHVQALMAAQVQLPPITVHRATMQVIDGFHRLKAARLRGDDKVAVRFFDGDEAAAFVLAVKLNVTHGLPLALADRKSAAERIIGSYPQWSDRKVAGVSGISPGTVAEIRKRIGRDAEGTHDNATGRSGGRIGQDGRVRPLDGAARRMLAGELLTENPGLSLRQVARAAAISPETARDVRNRLRMGEDLRPKPRGRRPGSTGGKVLDRREEFANARHVQPLGRPPRAPVPDRAAVVKWLKADPALRFTETGRNLLRLLTLHTHWTEEWEAVITNVPPHCTDIVADLARQFAELWTDLAIRVQGNVAKVS